MSATSQTDSCEGRFNFMAASTEPSLWRNGRVFIRRDPDGNTSASQGINLKPQTVPVFNARGLTRETRMTLGDNGFELADAPLDDPAFNFLDHATVVLEYYPACAALVEGLTGARAYAFDHNIRSAGGKQAGQRIIGGQHVQEPAHVVHGDYTLCGAPERLGQLAKPPSGNDTLRDVLQPGESLIPAREAERALADGGRFAIINVWRNIDDQPVASHPLGLCDGRTVAPDELVVFEIHYPDRIGENYFARYSPEQKMYYYPHMTRDEALLIKQWDSAGPLARSMGEAGDASDASAPCTFSFHSAFVDPAALADAPDRWSIEVRCMVIYD